MTTINVRVDDDVKRQANTLFAELGLDMSTAINLFLHRAIAEEGLPFEVKRHPNSETLAALKELEAIKNGTLQAKRYTDAEKMFEELDADEAEV